MLYYLNDDIDILETSTESIRISPPDISTILNKAAMIELLPDPVRPITPIFSEDLVSKLMFFMDGFRCSLF